MPIDIIPSGDYPIYESPPADEYDQEPDENIVKKWELGDGGVMLLIGKKLNRFERLKQNLANPRRIEPIFAPLPEQYSDFPGYVELRPGERILVYRPTSTGKKVFQHTRYEDVT